MPVWSSEVANEFIELAAADGRAFTQMHLQELVYIAHGWCLALTGQPLTGDRPEAREHGPEYRRLADALARHGISPVTSPIKPTNLATNLSKSDSYEVDANDFEPNEIAIMVQVYAEYGRRSIPELAALTRADNTPWARVYADGTGDGRDIPHSMIRDQFAEIADQLRA